MTTRRGVDRGDLPEWLDLAAERRSAPRRLSGGGLAGRRSAAVSASTSTQAASTTAKPTAERRVGNDRRAATQRAGGRSAAGTQALTDRRHDPRTKNQSADADSVGRRRHSVAGLAPGVFERRLLLFATILLLLYGLVMAYSSSTAQGYFNYHSSYYFIAKQVLFAGIGLSVMFVLAHVDYIWYRRLALPFAIASVVLLLAVLVPGLGTVVNGARRWIVLGGQSVTPSEFAKLASVMLVASVIANRPAIVLEAKGLATLIGIGILPAAGLIMLEPDLGTTLVLVSAVAAVLVVAGARVRHLGALAATAFVLVAGLIVVEPYRLARFTAFLHPLKDAQGANWQGTQSLVSIASGHIFGVGLGNSIQKFGYLPEPNTDMITGIIGEELGLVGLLLLVGCYIFLAWAAFKIALSCRELFGKLLAVGIISILVGQASINIGAALGVLPLTGVPLPLVSVGGTSLVVVLAGIGILLNIATNRRSHIGVSPERSSGSARRRGDGRPHHAGAGSGRGTRD
jgi:cell division protein FtsW